MLNVTVRSAERQRKQPEVVNVGKLSRLVGANTGSEEEIRSPSLPQASSSRERYGQMWQQYSEEVNCSTPAELDFKVGRRAFEAGVGQKEITLMLAAGSPTVKRMIQEQRKVQAMKYVNRVAQLTCQRPQRQTQWKLHRHQQMELGD